MIHSCETYQDYFQKVFHAFCVVLLENIDNIREFRVLLIVSKKFRALKFPGYFEPVLWNDFAREFNDKLEIYGTTHLMKKTASQMAIQKRVERKYDAWKEYKRLYSTKSPRLRQIAANKYDERINSANRKYRYESKTHKSYESGTVRHIRKHQFLKDLEDILFFVFLS